MRTIAVVIGHGPRVDTGADNKRSGKTELDYNTQLASFIKLEFDAHNSPDVRCQIVHRVKERLQPVTETNNTGARCAIELHCNSSDGKASGTEMIYCPGSTKGKRLASLLQHAAVQVLGLPDRGHKEPWQGRGLRWLKGTKMPAVIVESFFIDNDHDLAIGDKRMIALAKAYANVLLNF